MERGGARNLIGVVDAPLGVAPAFLGGDQDIVDGGVLEEGEEAGERELAVGSVHILFEILERDVEAHAARLAAVQDAAGDVEERLSVGGGGVRRDRAGERARRSRRSIAGTVGEATGTMIIRQRMTVLPRFPKGEGAVTAVGARARRPRARHGARCETAEQSEGSGVGHRYERRGSHSRHARDLFYPARRWSAERYGAKLASGSHKKHPPAVEQTPRESCDWYAIDEIPTKRSRSGSA